MSMLSNIFDEEDWGRLKMGRFSDADEKMILAMMRQKAGASLFHKIMGSGADMSRPALKRTKQTTRPKSSTGQRTFHFNLTAHTIGSGRNQIRPGQAASAHRYIDRTDISESRQKDDVEFACGMLKQEDSSFWNHVEIIEGAGRIQHSIKAELPFETEIGEKGRAQIVRRFCSIFDELNLPWRAVVHRPDAQGDERNYHLHVLFHDRAATRGTRGLWRFGEKSQACRPRSFIMDLRTRYADAINHEFVRIKNPERWHLGSYKKLNIHQRPGVHLGSHKMDRERKGLSTHQGTHNIGCYFERRFDRLSHGLDQARLRDVHFVNHALGIAKRAGVNTISLDVLNAVRMLHLTVSNFSKHSEQRIENSGNAQWHHIRYRELPLRTKQIAGSHKDRGMKNTAIKVARKIQRSVKRSRLSAMATLAHSRHTYRQIRQQVIGDIKHVEAELLLTRHRHELSKLKKMQDDIENDRRLSESEWKNQTRVIELKYAGTRRLYIEALNRHEIVLTKYHSVTAVEKLISEISTPRKTKHISQHEKIALGLSQKNSEEVLASIESLRLAALAANKAENSRRIQRHSGKYRRERFIICDADRKDRSARLKQQKCLIADQKKQTSQNTVASALAEKRGIKLAGKNAKSQQSSL